MHYAVQTASAPTIKLLLLYNADINAQDRVMMLKHSYISECVRWLVDTLYFFFFKFQDGWTPLHVAVQARRSDIVKLLLIKGADIQVKNKASSITFPLVRFCIIIVIMILMMPFFFD